jgi:hypothetical protein
MSFAATLILLASLGAQSNSTAQPAEAQAPVSQIDAAAARPTSASAVPSLYSSVVAKRKLQKKAADMTKAFGSTPAGAAVTIVATLVPYGQRPYNFTEFSIMGYELQYLAQNPADSLAAIQRGFSNLPLQYWAERQFLVQFAARLPLSHAQVLSFLASEVNRPMQLGPSGKPDASSFTGVIAFDAIMRVTQDQTQIESILVPALKSKTDVRERQALLARYRTLYPSHAGTLSLQFAVAGTAAH